MYDNKFISGIITGIFSTLAVVAVATVILVITFGDGFQKFSPSKDTKTSKTIESSKDDIINKLEYLVEEIDNESIYKVDQEKVIEGIYHGVFDSLDDKYSEYYSAEEYAKFNEQTTGEYCGIGAYIGEDAEGGYVYISSPMKGSPAEKAGIRAGDIIYKVDDHSAENADSDTVVSWIKGEAGTKVKIVILREGEEDYLTFEITRKQIEVPTVELEMLEDNLAHITVTSFDSVTTEQFANALDEAKSKKAQGLVIDLRSNPGGSLQVVSEMADMFLKKGSLIVYTEDKNKKKEQIFAQDNEAVNLPMVLLVNGYSASASEIFAGVVRDYKLGKLVGTKTFGKGIVQTVIPLQDGSAVKFTTAKYFTPKGDYIHDKGIEPDVKVEFDSEKFYNDKVDNQLQEAAKVLKNEIKVSK